MIYANSIIGGFLFALGFFLANVLVHALFHQSIVAMILAPMGVV